MLIMLIRFYHLTYLTINTINLFLLIKEGENKKSKGV
jgi:hypothetical protein